jgi:hypothetical protein
MGTREGACRRAPPVYGSRGGSGLDVAVTVDEAGDPRGGLAALIVAEAPVPRYYEA